MVPLNQQIKAGNSPCLCLATLTEGGGGVQLASGSEDGGVRIYDLMSPTFDKCLTGASLKEEVNCIIWASPFVLYVASGSNIHGLDTRIHNGPVISRGSNLFPASDTINNLAHKLNYLSVVDDSGRVQVLDIRKSAGDFFGSLNPVKKFRSKHQNLAMCTAFHPLRRWEVWSGGMDAALIRWDFSRGSIAEQFDMNDTAPSAYQRGINPPFVHSMAIFPEDGKTVLSGLGDGSIHVLDQKPGKKESWSSIRLSVGHSWTVSALNFLPNMQGSFISAGLDGKIIHWKGIENFEANKSIDEEQKMIQTEIQTQSKVNCMTSHVGSDGRITVFTGGVSQTTAPGNIDVSWFNCDNENSHTLPLSQKSGLR